MSGKKFKKNMEKIVDNFDKLYCLVVGDVMLDVFEYMSLKGPSPESSASVYTLEKVQYSPGGAANVVSNIKTLGGNPTIIGMIGNDNYGSILRKQMKNTLGIFYKEKNRPTTMKRREIIVSERGSNDDKRVDDEKTHDINPGTENKIISYIKSCKFNKRVAEINDFNVIILSDYRKGILTEKLCRYIIKLADENNIPVVVDPKSEYHRFDGACLFKPNKKEIMEMTKEKNIDNAVKKIFHQTKIKNILVTLGKDGMKLYQRNKKPIEIPAYGEKTGDVIGAGDTVTAILGLGLNNECKLEDAVRLSCIGAGIAIGKRGTSVITREELYKAINDTKY